MLYITFGTLDKLIEDDPKIRIDPDNAFKYTFRPEWLESDFAKRMVKIIDKSEVISPYCINSPIFGQISPFMLSGGVKALLLMLNMDSYMYVGAMGDNCLPFVVEMSKFKDVHLGVDGPVYFDGYNPMWEDRETYSDEERNRLKLNLITEMEAIITNTGKRIHTVDEYFNYYAYCDTKDDFEWLSTKERKQNDEYIAEMKRLGIDEDDW